MPAMVDVIGDTIRSVWRYCRGPALGCGFCGSFRVGPRRSIQDKPAPYALMLPAANLSAASHCRYWPKSARTFIGHSSRLSESPMGQVFGTRSCEVTNEAPPDVCRRRGDRVGWDREHSGNDEQRL
jgi:hypothetical protein